jgi:nitroreductase
MRKPAETQYDIHELLQNRWSPRAFSNRPVEADKLLSLFEAARWSPSGGNAQPWAFIVVAQADAQAHAGLVQAMKGRNPDWARHAPLLVLSVAIPQKPGQPIGRFAYYDVGQAVAYLSVQAAALGLQVHQMGGFDGEQARQLFAIPPECEPMTLIAIGYYGSADTLPDDLREREVAARTRKPLAEFVYGPGWGQPLPVVTP